MELRDIKKVHLVGAGGISMQGIAKVLESRGVDVSGCDVADQGHSPDHITKDLDIVIYSSAITPESQGYPELKRARELGVMVKKRAWVLGRLMQEKGKFGVAISGTHGKSTTTAMVGKILVEAGQDPLVLNGALMPEYGGPARLGNGEYVVVEADEYDRSFHQLVPKAAVMLNIEAEHLDYYARGLPEIVRAFREFVKLVPSKGVVVVNQNDKSAVAVAKSAKAKVKFFSLDKPWPGLHLKVWGEHNLANATAAARLCHELGIESNTIQKALNNFTGVKRRMEFKGSKDGVDVYDDYAHHPSEIKATLAAAREHFGKRRLVVIFEPHQYSRTKLLFADFTKSFEQAQQLLLAPIYAVAGRDSAVDISSDDLAAAINAPPTVSLDEQGILTWLTGQTKPGDVVITMGAGPIHKIGEQWISNKRSKSR